MIFEGAAIAIIVAIIMALYRAVAGPRVFDRVLAVNAIGTKTVVLIAVFGYIYGRPHFLDIALVYAFINFMTTIAFLKYREKGRLD
ncbi:MAG: monovalent cation/H+ antiporter complex subunit F [Thermodesulfobacteriota bacterium]|nr:MAG: monovalent cation/H+ antiporter complex subunit F [Thermodesulfobacteriota bacterium]